MPISIIEARALYDAGAPVARVADQLGVSLRAFRDLRIANGWPLREPIARPAQAGAPDKPKPLAGPKKPASRKRSSRKLETSKNPWANLVLADSLGRVAEGR